MNEFNFGKYMQLCSLMKSSDCKDFTDFCVEMCNSPSRDVFNWVSEHFDISYRAWKDIHGKA